jgi:hypothetical protein
MLALVAVLPGIVTPELPMLLLQHPCTSTSVMLKINEAYNQCMWQINMQAVKKQVRREQWFHITECISRPFLFLDRKIPR